MKIKTRVFELIEGKDTSLSELAHDMGISVSQIYRVKTGKRNINQKFIAGAMKAFPQYSMDELFFITLEAPSSGNEERDNATPPPYLHRHNTPISPTRSSW